MSSEQAVPDDVAVAEAPFAVHWAVSDFGRVTLNTLLTVPLEKVAGWPPLRLVAGFGFDLWATVPEHVGARYRVLQRGGADHLAKKPKPPHNSY